MATSTSIGFFDSGVGGLSVLRHALRSVGGKPLLYVADSAYAPYGRRAADQVVDRCRRISRFLIEQGADVHVSDIDSVDFDGGSLTVSLAAGSDASEGVLSIRNQGTGLGQIGFDGTNVTYEGLLIGTASGGSGGADLVISLNAAATPTAVAALMENLTYENTDTVDPTLGSRQVSVTLNDGDGATSFNHDATVNLPGVNTAVILDRFEAVSYSNNDGTANWVGDWVEFDSSGLGETGGRFAVDNLWGDNRLHIQASSAGDYIVREADLSGTTAATLSLDYDNRLGGSATLWVDSILGTISEKVARSAGSISGVPVAAGTARAVFQYSSNPTETSSTTGPMAAISSSRNSLVTLVW